MPISQCGEPLRDRPLDRYFSAIDRCLGPERVHRTCVASASMKALLLPCHEIVIVIVCVCVGCHAIVIVIVCVGGHAWHRKMLLLETLDEPSLLYEPQWRRCRYCEYGGL